MSKMYYIENSLLTHTGELYTTKLKQEYETLRDAQDFLDSKLAEAWMNEHDIIEMTPTKVAIDWFRMGDRDIYEVKEEPRA